MADVVDEVAFGEEEVVEDVTEQASSAGDIDDGPSDAVEEDIAIEGVSDHFDTEPLDVTTVKSGGGDSGDEGGDDVKADVAMEVADDDDLSDEADDADDDEEYCETDLELDDSDGEDETPEEVYRAACAKLKTTPVSQFLHHASDPKVNLSHRGLGEKGTFALAETLQHNLAVDTVIVPDNRMGAEGVAALMESFANNDVIRDLDLACNIIRSGGKAVAAFLGPSQSIRNVNLSENFLGDKEAAALAEAVAENTSLEQLNLSRNQLGETAGANFGRALQANSSLQELDLSWNNIRLRGATLLASGIGAHAKLRVVHLQWNGFADDGAKAVAAALKATSSIEFLDLSRNRIGDEGAIAIGSALEGNTSVKTLLLSGNALGFVGVSALLTAAIRNQTFTKLDLSAMFFASDTIAKCADFQTPTPPLEDALSAHQAKQYELELEEQKREQYQELESRIEAAAAELATCPAESAADGACMDARLNHLKTQQRLVLGDDLLKLWSSASLACDKLEASVLPEGDAEMAARKAAVAGMASVEPVSAVLADTAQVFVSRGGDAACAETLASRLVEGGQASWHAAKLAYADLMDERDDNTAATQRCLQILARGGGAAFYGAHRAFVASRELYPQDFQRARQDASTAFATAGGPLEHDPVNVLHEIYAASSACDKLADMVASGKSIDDVLEDGAENAYASLQGSTPFGDVKPFLEAATKARAAYLIASQTHAAGLDKTVEKAKKATKAAESKVEEEKDANLQAGKRPDFELKWDKPFQKQNPMNPLETILDFLDRHQLGVEVFARVDVDNTGWLHRDELLAAIQTVGVGLSPEEITSIMPKPEHEGHEPKIDYRELFGFPPALFPTIMATPEPSGVGNDSGDVDGAPEESSTGHD
eukprot:m.128974 g.128974  ORF g.128974 m.128974 type:complete len:885 (-) comp16750_c0_seq8:1316-3970(-)